MERQFVREVEGCWTLYWHRRTRNSKRLSIVIYGHTKTLFGVVDEFCLPVIVLETVYLTDVSLSKALVRSNFPFTSFTDKTRLVVRSVDCSEDLVFDDVTACPAEFKTGLRDVEGDVPLEDPNQHFGWLKLFIRNMWVAGKLTGSFARPISASAQTHTHTHSTKKSCSSWPKFSDKHPQCIYMTHKGQGCATQRTQCTFACIYLVAVFAGWNPWMVVELFTRQTCVTGSALEATVMVNLVQGRDHPFGQGYVLPTEGTGACIYTKVMTYIDRVLTEKWALWAKSLLPWLFSFMALFSSFWNCSSCGNPLDGGLVSFCGKHIAGEKQCLIYNTIPFFVEGKEWIVRQISLSSLEFGGGLI